MPVAEHIEALACYAVVLQSQFTRQSEFCSLPRQFERLVGIAVAVCNLSQVIVSRCAGLHGIVHKAEKHLSLPVVAAGECYIAAIEQCGVRHLSRRIFRHGSEFGISLCILAKLHERIPVAVTIAGKHIAGKRVGRHRGIMLRRPAIVAFEKIRIGHCRFERFPVCSIWLGGKFTADHLTGMCVAELTGLRDGLTTSQKKSRICQQSVLHHSHSVFKRQR